MVKGRECPIRHLLKQIAPGGCSSEKTVGALIYFMKLGGGAGPS